MDINYWYCKENVDMLSYLKCQLFLQSEVDEQCHYDNNLI